MSAPISQDRLEIEAQDFGPIVHAKLDLRPMTVFIGPSNTGKSYLAMLIYALHRFLGGVNQPPLGIRRVGLWRSNLGFTVPEPTEEIIAAFVQLAQEISDSSLGQKDAGIVLPDRIIASLRSEFDRSGYEMGSEILRCFGMDATTALVRKGQAERARLTIRHGNDDALLEHILSFDSQAADFQTEIPPNVNTSSAGMDGQALHYQLENIRFHLRDISAVSKRPEDDVWPIAYLSVTSSLMDLVLHQMFGDLDLRAFYLPADRTGVMHAHSAVVSAVVDSAPMAGLRPVTRTPYFLASWQIFSASLSELTNLQVGV